MHALIIVAEESVVGVVHILHTEHVMDQTLVLDQLPHKLLLYMLNSERRLN
jgi:hypothetical protein